MLGEEETFRPIFAKNLSDQSTGIYQLLSYAVGKRFEAVPAQDATPLLQSATTVCLPCKPVTMGTDLFLPYLSAAFAHWQEFYNHDRGS